VEERNEKKIVRPSAVKLGELTKRPIFAQFGSGELDTNNEKQRALDGVGKTRADKGPRANNRIRRSTPGTA
jgi:hypothetical protein